MTGKRTPATVLLTSARVAHTVHSYVHDDRTAEFGNEAAEIMVSRLGIDSGQILKTLVVRTAEGQLAVAVIPVPDMLSLKSVAAALGTRKVSMAARNEAERSTGYVSGGISPLGQRKRLSTVIDESALRWDAVLVSAGRRGLEIELDPRDLVRLTEAHVAVIAAN